MSNTIKITAAVAVGVYSTFVAVAVWGKARKRRILKHRAHEETLQEQAVSHIKTVIKQDIRAPNKDAVSAESTGDYLLKLFALWQAVDAFGNDKTTEALSTVVGQLEMFILCNKRGDARMGYIDEMIASLDASSQLRKTI